MQTTSQNLTEREAAQFLGLSTSNLQKRRFHGLQPHYVKLGKSVRYPLEDLRAFLDSCRVRVNEAA